MAENASNNDTEATVQDGHLQPFEHRGDQDDIDIRATHPIGPVASTIPSLH